MPPSGRSGSEPHKDSQEKIPMLKSHGHCVSSRPASYGMGWEHKQPAHCRAAAAGSSDDDQSPGDETQPPPPKLEFMKEDMTDLASVPFVLVVWNTNDERQRLTFHNTLSLRSALRHIRCKAAHRRPLAGYDLCIT